VIFAVTGCETAFFSNAPRLQGSLHCRELLEPGCRTWHPRELNEGQLAAFVETTNVRQEGAVVGGSYCGI